jgi:diadenosine tetraphosphate (Ap4A) HIT family hydrolase
MEGRHCALCEADVTLPDAVIVERTDHWLVYVHPRYPTPGQVWVQTTEHVEGSWAMNPGQAASFGDVLQRAARAVRIGHRAERVYLVSFGENHQHFHAMLIARRLEDASNRGLALVAQNLVETGEEDLPGASEAAAALRACL